MKYETFPLTAAETLHLLAVQDVYKRQSQFMTDSAAFHNLFLGEPVAAGMQIASADAAVIAVVFAIVSKFNQAPDKNTLSILLVSNLTGFFR